MEDEPGGGVPMRTPPGQSLPLFGNLRQAGERGEAKSPPRAAPGTSDRGGWSPGQRLPLGCLLSHGVTILHHESLLGLSAVSLDTLIPTAIVSAPPWDLGPCGVGSQPLVPAEKCQHS